MDGTIHSQENTETFFGISGKRLWETKVYGIRIPRYYFTGLDGEVRSATLHGFKDLSKKKITPQLYIWKHLRVKILFQPYRLHKIKSSSLFQPSVLRFDLLASLITSHLVNPSYTKLFRTHTLYQGGGGGGSSGLPYYLIKNWMYKRQILQDI